MNGVVYVRDKCPECRGDILVNLRLCPTCKGEGILKKVDRALEHLADDVVNGIDKRRRAEPVAASYIWR